MADPLRLLASTVWERFVEKAQRPPLELREEDLLGITVDLLRQLYPTLQILDNKVQELIEIGWKERKEKAGAQAAVAQAQLSDSLAAGAGGAGGGSGAPELLANALSALTGQAGSGGGATGAPGPSGPAPAGPDNRGDSRYYGGGANLAALAQLNSLGGLGGPGAVGPIGGGGGLKRPASAMDGGAGAGGERFGGDRRGDGEPEWECQCGNTNWATRPVCRKCGSPRDGEAGPAGPTTMRTAYSSFRGNNNERVRKGSCWNCGSMEHLKVECPYLDGKAAPTICPCKYQKGSCAYENTGCRFLGLPVSTCHGYLVGKCSDKECSLTHLEAPACPHVFQKGTCMFGKDCMLADRPVDECCFPTCMRGETCRRRHQFHKVTDENGVKCYVHPTKPQHMGKGKGRRWEEGGGGGYGKGRKGGYDRGYDRGYDDYDEQGGAGGGGGGGGGGSGKGFDRSYDDGGGKGGYDGGKGGFDRGYGGGSKGYGGGKGYSGDRGFGGGGGGGGFDNGTGMGGKGMGGGGGYGGSGGKGMGGGYDDRGGKGFPPMGGKGAPPPPSFDSGYGPSGGGGGGGGGYPADRSKMPRTSYDY